MIGSCCETQMFGDFTRGFWISFYCGRVRLPRLCAMTAERRPVRAFPDDGVPRFRSRPGEFLVTLLTAWGAIGFRNPRRAGVPD